MALLGAFRDWGYPFWMRTIVCRVLEKGVGPFSKLRLGSHKPLQLTKPVDRSIAFRKMSYFLVQCQLPASSTTYDPYSVGFLRLPRQLLKSYVPH